MDEVFADDFRCSMPAQVWGDLRSHLDGVSGDAGFLPDIENDRVHQLRLDGGTVKSELTRGLRVVSCSGQALARLRSVGLLGEFLGVIVGNPHRVTGLHATLDRREPTPPVLARLLARSESEDGLRAGRKRIPVSSLERHLRRRPDGLDTGTIYCGGKHAEIRPTVYDKREERLSRGMPDLGYDLTRYELRLRSGVKMTLGDVLGPAGVFWHYMAPDFLDRPVDAPVWSAGAEGFCYDRPDPPLPAVRLLRAAEGSGELRQLVRLAGAFPGGLDYLMTLVRRLDHDGSLAPIPAGVDGLTSGVQGPAPAVTLSGELSESVH